MLILEYVYVELVNKNFYGRSIKGMRLRLSKLQKSEKEAQKIKTEDLNEFKDIDGMLHHQRLPYIHEII